MSSVKKPKRVLFATFWWLEDLMRAVAHQAAARGWLLDFQMCLAHRLPETWHGDGIITNLSGSPDELAAFLEKARCPAVSLSQLHPEIELPRVGMDETTAGRLAARHFLDRGFQSFAHYTRDPLAIVEGINTAFSNTVAAKGYDAFSLDWQHERGNVRDTWRNRHDWLRRQLRQLPKPLAVLAREPLAPAESIEAAMEEGLDVPHDVAVLGVFDIAMFRESTTVPVSCIIHDFEEHARVACELLDRLMEGEPVPRTPILLPSTVVATRRSTDTIAARTPVVAKVVRYMLRNFSDDIAVRDIRTQ